MTPPSAPSHLTTPAATEYCCVTARVPAFVPPCDVMLARPHEFGPFSYYHARGAAVPAHLQSRVKITSRHTHEREHIHRKAPLYSVVPTPNWEVRYGTASCSMFIRLRRLSVVSFSWRSTSCTLKYSFQYQQQQHIGSFAWATRLAVSCPHNWNETEIKHWNSRETCSSFSQSKSVSAVYGLARKQRTQTVIG